MRNWNATLASFVVQLLEGYNMKGIWNAIESIQQSDIGKIIDGMIHTNAIFE